VIAAALAFSGQETLGYRRTELALAVIKSERDLISTGSVWSGASGVTSL